MHIRLRIPAAQGGDDVLRQEFSLPYRVLGVGHRRGTGQLRGKVGNRGVVTRAPGVRHRRGVGADPQVGADRQHPALVDGQVGVAADHRVRRVADRPDDQFGVELLAGGQDHVAVAGRDELGIEVHAGTTLLQRAHHPAAGPVGHLGKYPAARFHEVEVQLRRTQFGIGPHQRCCQRQQLTEAFDPGETTPDEGHGEKPPAQRAGLEHRGLVEGRQQAVPDRHGFLDVLHANRMLGYAGDSQLARHRAGGDDDDVVAERKRGSFGRADGDRPVPVVDPGHAAGDEPCPAQVPAQGYGGVPGLDRTGQHLRQERLVRHVRPGIDHDDPRLAPAEFLFQFPGRVEAGVATADHQDRPHIVLCSFALTSYDRTACRFVTPGGDGYRGDRAPVSEVVADLDQVLVGVAEVDGQDGAGGAGALDRASSMGTLSTVANRSIP